MLLSQVLTAEYDAIVFISAARYPGDNTDAIRIARKAQPQAKFLLLIVMLYHLDEGGSSERETGSSTE